jgi:drug/metabolite transporter (DMT)-like permease
VAELGRESLSAPSAIDGVLIVIAVSGISFSGPLIAATAAPALAIAFWRNALGAVATIPVALIRCRPELKSITWPALQASIVAGFVLALHFATWIPSVTMTSVASATALVATQSVFVAVIAHVNGRRLPRAAWIGVTVSTMGTVLVTGADLGLSGRALAGDGLAILGGLFAAGYVTIGARARQELSAVVYTAICYTVCSVVLLVVCVVGGVNLGGYSGDAWLKIVLVTICAQLLGHSLINVALRSTSPTVISLAILVETPGAAIVAAIWLHQRPADLALPGMALLLVGLVLVIRARGRRQPVPLVD